jgi:hypothetical protein
MPPPKRRLHQAPRRTISYQFDSFVPNEWNDRLVPCVVMGATGKGLGQLNPVAGERQERITQSRDEVRRKASRQPGDPGKPADQ